MFLRQQRQPSRGLPFVVIVVVVIVVNVVQIGTILEILLTNVRLYRTELPYDQNDINDKSEATHYRGRIFDCDKVGRYCRLCRRGLCGRLVSGELSAACS